MVRGQLSALISQPLNLISYFCQCSTFFLGLPIYITLRRHNSLLLVKKTWASMFNICTKSPVLCMWLTIVEAFVHQFLSDYWQSCLLNFNFWRSQTLHSLIASWQSATIRIQIVSHPKFLLSRLILLDYREGNIIQEYFALSQVSM